MVLGTGVALTASPVLSGGVNETGTIALTLFSPSNVSVFTAVVAVSGNDHVTIGNGTGDSVTVVGNGNDTITTGTGSGTVHVAGTGHKTVTLVSKGWIRI